MSAPRKVLVPSLLALLAAATAESQPDPLARWQGRIVRALELTGHEVTKEHVIRREILTRVGAPFDLHTPREDAQRLENIAIFSEVRVEAEADGDDGVRLSFTLKESPSWLPLVSFTFTEENGFSIGPGVSALNLLGRGSSLSGRAYFGGTTQYWADFN